MPICLENVQQFFEEKWQKKTTFWYYYRAAGTLHFQKDMRINSAPPSNHTGMLVLAHRNDKEARSIAVGEGAIPPLDMMAEGGIYDSQKGIVFFVFVPSFLLIFSLK